MSIEVIVVGAGPFLRAGLVVPSWHFGFLEQRIDFTGLDSPFPFVLSLPQQRTEELLEEWALSLGATIVRGETVTGLSQDDDGVRVLTDSGERRAAWVVGADGATSVVRRAAGIAFEGTGSRIFSYLGDVVADHPPGPGFTVVNENGSMMVAPIPGGLVRVAGYDPLDQEPGRRELGLDELREVSGRIAGADLGLRDPAWLTRFGNATRVAATYRRGRVLLAGDAAHIHFPAGGVGLNLGVQDAMNLGWKLAAVVQGRATEDLLDTYDAERRPWGADVARHILAQTALITATTPEGLALRALLSDLLGRLPDMSALIARRLSGLDVHYPPADPAAHPLTGTRVAELGDRLHAGRAVLVTDGGPDVVVRPDGYIWWTGEGAPPSLGATF
ncbi:FAD-dependent monooxygenase [Actinoplanes sp. NPDC051494]|uniref:FAD-dependent monooxygenase n=1 Tax=Actinoplanes sp. NPDC051494 TaxID=3363907 RepID=UPI003790B48F